MSEYDKKLNDHSQDVIAKRTLAYAGRRREGLTQEKAGLRESVQYVPMPPRPEQ